MYPGQGRSSERGYRPQNAGTDTTASRRLTAWSRRLLPYIPRSLPDNRAILKQETRHSFTLVEWILDRRLLDGRLGSTPWMGLWMQDDLPMWWSKYISMCWSLLMAAMIDERGRRKGRRRAGAGQSASASRAKDRKGWDGTGSGCVSGYLVESECYKRVFYSSSMVISHHQSSSIIIHHQRPSSSIIINHHQSSSIVVNQHHQSSSIIIGCTLPADVN